MNTPIITTGMTGFQRTQIKADRLAALKKALTAAFRSLRSQGIIAKQNFGGSQWDAQEAMGRLVQERLDAGRKVTGAVWYNRQTGELFADEWDLYIGYAGVQATSTGYDQPEARTLEVGHALVKALQDQGLTVYWNGRGGTKVRVYHWPETQTLFPTGSTVICPADDGEAIVRDHKGPNVEVTFDAGTPNEHYHHYPHQWLTRKVA